MTAAENRADYYKNCLIDGCGDECEGGCGCSCVDDDDDGDNDGDDGDDDDDGVVRIFSVPISCVLCSHLHVCVRHWIMVVTTIAVSMTMAMTRAKAVAVAVAALTTTVAMWMNTVTWEFRRWVLTWETLPVIVQLSMHRLRRLDVRVLFWPSYGRQGRLRMLS